MSEPFETKCAKCGNVMIVQLVTSPPAPDALREAAERFVAALSDAGAAAQLKVFPGAGHEETGDMRLSATRFLAGN